MSSAKRPAWALNVLAIITLTAVLLATAQSWGTGADPIADACHALQPRLTPAAATAWSKSIRAADVEASIGDPYLLVALIMRESSFDPLVAAGTKRGRLGERGPMQVHGVALRFAPQGCRGRYGHARCLLRTGAAWLARRRADCPGSRRVWIASYGRARCATEEQALADTATNRAWGLYQRIRPGVDWD